jgi:hypothetical protein
MTWNDAGRAIRVGAVALLSLGSILGCGGGGSGPPAVTAKADAVDVTYYYLPG